MAPTAPNSPAMSKPVLRLEGGREACDQALRRAAAQNVQGSSRGKFHRRDQAVARDRQVAHAHAEAIEHRIGNRRRDRAVRGLAGADRLDLRPLDDFDLAPPAPR